MPIDDGTTGRNFSLRDPQYGVENYAQDKCQPTDKDEA
jgi:hypothetical protein